LAPGYKDQYAPADLIPITLENTMLNIGIVSQARLGSSRLPAKVLRPAGGKTLLDWHFERLAKSGYTSFLATTDLKSDDPLHEWANEVGVTCFRGSEQNVLSRFRNCARQFKLDVIVRVTSDCPLIDGELVATGINQFLEIDEPRQYMTNGQRRTFPRGFDFEIFSYELLEEAYQSAENSAELEHVTPYFYQSGDSAGVSASRKGRAGRRHQRLDIMRRNFTQHSDNSHLRVTVDTIEDYELVRVLIEDFNAGHKNHLQITNILNDNPQLVAINQDIIQKQVV